MNALSVVRGPARLSGHPPGARWAPPSPRLGQIISDDERSRQLVEIDSVVREIAVELALRTKRLVGELEVSQDPSLRAGIPLLGRDLSSAEIASQVMLVGRGLEGIATSVLDGPLEVYASPDIATSLEESRGTLRALINQAQPFAAPLLEGHEGLAEEHLLSYVEDLQALRDSAERLLVATEQAPPVYEPGEKEGAVAPAALWVLGALSVGAIVAFLVTSD